MNDFELFINSSLYNELFSSDLESNFPGLPNILRTLIEKEEVLFPKHSILIDYLNKFDFIYYLGEVEEAFDIVRFAINKKMFAKSDRFRIAIDDYLLSFEQEKKYEEKYKFLNLYNQYIAEPSNLIENKIYLGKDGCIRKLLQLKNNHVMYAMPIKDNSKKRYYWANYGYITKSKIENILNESEIISENQVEKLLYA